MARMQINPASQPPTAQKEGPSTSADDITQLLDRKRQLEATPDVDAGTSKSLKPGVLVDSSLKERLAGISEEISDLEKQNKEDQQYISENDSTWLKLSNDAFDGADQYFQDNQASKLKASISIYHNKHPDGSPFSDGGGGLDWSSKVFRPKTRTVLNKFEADAAHAYFSNPDVVSIEAENPNDKQELLAADVMKSVLNFRLRKSIKWYHLCMGAFQDAEVQGSCIAYIDWVARYQDKTAEVQSIYIDKSTGLGQPVTKTVQFKIKVEDRPRAELISLDNIRFDPASDWDDVIGKSPYLIILRQMYVYQVKEDERFKKIDDAVLTQAIQNSDNSLSKMRAQSKTDPNAVNIAFSDLSIVTVREVIYMKDGVDYTWFTLDNVAMLTDPIPLKDKFFHGQRPLVMGSIRIEPHTAYMESEPEVYRGLQEEINTIANQRLDNVKLVMNKKYAIKSDSTMDLYALLENRPGSTVITEDPEKDFREISTPDVTQSAYVEQDALDKDFNDLAGSFDPPLDKMNQPGVAASMGMMDDNAGNLIQYKLKTFSTTFVEPFLQLLAKYEQYYENDKVVLALAGQNAQAFEKYGVKDITNELLRKELTIRVNVGLNATNPQKKLQKFMGALAGLAKLMGPTFMASLDKKEIIKEVMALSGYGDGVRFMDQENTPEKAQIAQLLKYIQTKEADHKVKLQIAEENNRSREKIEAAKIEQDAAELHAEITGKLVESGALPPEALHPQATTPAAPPAGSPETAPGNAPAATPGT